MAEAYKIVIEPEPELGFMGRSVEMPHVWGDGRTPTECVKSVREALIAVVATMLEMGERPPAPASEAKRQVQLNIRLTDEEKLLLEEAARRDGFRGLSDFVRAAALAKAG